MNPATNIAPATVRPRRYSEVEEPKSAGATYTPANLAKFVAEAILNAAELSTAEPLRILDPAVGDGALLEALLSKLPKGVSQIVEVFGYDTDGIAVANARQRLRSQFPKISFHLEEKDFLQYVLEEHCAAP